MSAPLTATDLRSLIERSGLLDASQLDPWFTNGDTDPDAITFRLARRPPPHPVPGPPAPPGPVLQGSSSRISTRSSTSSVRAAWARCSCAST